MPTSNRVPFDPDLPAFPHSLSEEETGFLQRQLAATLDDDLEEDDEDEPEEEEDDIDDAEEDEDDLDEDDEQEDDDDIAIEEEDDDEVEPEDHDPDEDGTEVDDPASVKKLMVSNPNRSRYFQAPHRQ